MSYFSTDLDAIYDNQQWSKFKDGYTDPFSVFCESTNTADAIQRHTTSFIPSLFHGNCLLLLDLQFLKSDECLNPVINIYDRYQRFSSLNAQYARENEKLSWRNVNNDQFQAFYNFWTITHHETDTTFVTGRNISIPITNLKHDLLFR